MDQHCFTGGQVCHSIERDQRREVVDGQRRAFSVAESRRQREDKCFRHHDAGGIPAKARERDHPFAGKDAGDAGADAVNDSGDFVADHQWRFGRVGIKPETCQHVREIHPGGADGNPNFAVRGGRGGYLARGQHFGRAVPEKMICRMRAEYSGRMQGTFRRIQMRGFLAGVAAVAFFLALGAPASAKTVTVKGQVVDEGCSLKEMSDHKGGDHKVGDHQAGDHQADHTDGDHKMPASMDDCALECAKRGEPLALLTTDGKVYRITGGLAANNNAKLIPHMKHTVEITGEVTEKDGKVQITANDLKMSK